MNAQAAWGGIPRADLVKHKTAIHFSISVLNLPCTPFGVSTLHAMCRVPLNIVTVRPIIKCRFYCNNKNNNNNN